jgi:polyhydroxyalkanoate synthesis regulator phasin
MVLDGLRGYLQLANGLSDVTRERARVAAKSLVAQGEASVGAVLPGSLKAQVGSLTEDLIATSKANRALLIGLVGTEVERATARLGLAMADELDSAKRRAQRLEQRVADLERQVRQALTGSAPSTSPAAQGTAAKKTSANKSTANKSTAKKSAAKKSAAKKSAAKKSTTKKAAAKKSTTNKAAAKRTTAKKTTAKKTTAKTTT